MFVIVGQLAAGKSSVAAGLLAHYPRGFHVDVDAIREMVASGYASPLDWTDETTRQFSLAIEAAARLAALYHRAGFAVAVEGAFDPADIDRHLAEEELDAVAVRIVLAPRIEVARERNLARTNKPFDTAILDEAISRIDRSLQTVLPGWTVVDNSDEDLETTIDRVLAMVPEGFARPG